MQLLQAIRPREAGRIALEATQPVQSGFPQFWQ
jgi:hypothetical protein